MVGDILGTQTITPNQLQMANNGIPIYLKEWKGIKSELILKDNNVLHLKSNPQLRMQFIEQWIEVVANVHVASPHLGVQETLATLKMSWSTNLRDYGLSLTYVKAFVEACGCQKIICFHPIDMVNKIITSCHEDVTPIEEYVVEDTKQVQKLIEIQLNHNACLQKAVRTSKYVLRYDCHRASNPRRVSNSSRRSNSAKRCRCMFYVKVREFEGNNQVKIMVYGHHSGHVPSSREDLYHLPVHESVIQCCTDDRPFLCRICKACYKNKFTKRNYS
mgnify:CR=1 FL=1